MVKKQDIMLTSTLILKRQPDEILDRINWMRQKPTLVEYIPAMVAYLPYEYAKPYLVFGVLKQEWQDNGFPFGSADLVYEIEGYLDQWFRAIKEKSVSTAMDCRVEVLNRLWLADEPYGEKTDLSRFYGTSMGAYDEECFKDICEIYQFTPIVRTRDIAATVSRAGGV